MNAGVMFLAGIHGVGKSSLAEFLEEKLFLPTYSASSLIKLEKNKPVDSSKRVLDPTLNQDFLVKAIRNLNTDENPIILDGHFVLLSHDGFFDIPISTFQSLPIVSIVLKILDVDAIRQRLLLRDNEAPDVEILNEFQDREVERAKKISSLLEVKLIVIESDDYENFDFNFELNIGDL